MDKQSPFVIFFTINSSCFYPLWFLCTSKTIFPNFQDHSRLTWEFLKFLLRQVAALAFHYRLFCRFCNIEKEGLYKKLPNVYLSIIGTVVYLSVPYSVKMICIFVKGWAYIIEIAVWFLDWTFRFSIWGFSSMVIIFQCISEITSDCTVQNTPKPVALIQQVIVKFFLLKIDN